ncbi:MAG: BglG family transcription antiterminator [Turicibacter sp.]|nr:BglG family transcription antiterminator [Turicibacter sp.]
MNLTQRQIQMIKRLFSEEAFVTSRYLSDIYRVSTRSIRYDLDTIEYHLEKQGLKLIRDRTNGISIEGSEKRKAAFLLLLENDDSNINFPYLIAIELLLQSKSTVQKLAEQLSVSRNKIIQSLPKVEHILSTVGVTLDKRPSIGMHIGGAENRIRMAKFKLNPLISTDLENYFSKRLSQHNEEKITQAIANYQTATGMGFSDQGVKELVLTLCYQQLRISQGHLITYSYEETKAAILSEEFETIIACFKQVKLELSVEEGIFVLHQIRNTQMVYLPEEKKEGVVHPDADALTREFALLVSERLGIDFLGNISFLNGLKLHLNVALHRLRSGQIIKNPLTEQIKYKYRFIFETCKQILLKLEHDYDLNFPDDEIAYVAMHVGACFEMSQQAGLMPKALVVCHSGLATSNLLATRLKVMLPELSILGPLGLSELTPELVSEVDFVISTIPFSLASKDLILVNPLLGIDDVLVLKKRVINIASKKQLSYLISETPEKVLQLGDLLAADALLLQRSVANWRSAIELAARPLLVAGSISDDYVQAMIEAVENFGPYMVFIQDIAVVHAEPSRGVLQEGLSVLTLEVPIVLGDMQGVPVSCFIVLATAEKESQLFMKLIRLLDNKDNVAKLLASASKEDVLGISNES